MNKILIQLCIYCGVFGMAMVISFLIISVLNSPLKKSFPVEKGCCHQSDCVFTSGIYGDGWCHSYWPDGTPYQSTFYKNGEAILGKSIEYNELGVKIK